MGLLPAGRGVVRRAVLAGLRAARVLKAVLTPAGNFIPEDYRWSQCRRALRAAEEPGGDQPPRPGEPGWASRGGLAS